MAIATCMGGDRMGHEEHLVEVKTMSQGMGRACGGRSCKISGAQLRLRGGGLADFMVPKPEPEKTNEGRRHRKTREVHYADNAENILSHSNMKSYRKSLREYQKLKMRDLDDEPFQRDLEDEPRDLNASHFPVSIFEDSKILCNYQHFARVRERYEASKKEFEDNYEEDHELYGVDRLKHGLRGFMPGPPKDLLEDLKKDGNDGPWNNPNDTSAWKPLSELWFPGHETFKYYKNGRQEQCYTGEKMDKETSDKWAGISNFYAPYMLGTTSLFQEDDNTSTFFGTLDWYLTKNRPETFHDETLKRTYWYRPSLGKRSLYRDGLLPHENLPPYEKRFLDLPDTPAGDNIYSQAAAEFHSKHPSYGDVLAAVDRLRTDFKSMFKMKVTPSMSPYVQLDNLVMSIIQSKWMTKQATVLDADDVYKFLIQSNNNMAAWSPEMWKQIQVSDDQLSKAQRANFFLGLTDWWLEGETKVKGSSTIVDKPIDDLTDIGRISGGIMMKVWQRERIDDSYHSSL
ncbi:hypothetical protein GUITHDRAFT_101019 [Guillardia theta CCMP2712]|uniref:Uncharacterized protein n=1 Tax=Guillardia theta (strain CCMP2712) TaxID=905079 RepID=L1JYC2_GUITC|nr:hypothetical protein GUITHDRAFT_101019 [Guillardia theta CCMP2712]EKX53314.1 hypothetical protein GUITHDRAFT_101019 [Guillardia theta CCMP2712]|eukprot:XP_005840294.1 hypothetical protein GUITHDRAFT_101019 [Guillardia theta CCMP2712]